MRRTSAPRHRRTAVTALVVGLAMPAAAATGSWDPVAAGSAASDDCTRDAQVSFGIGVPTGWRVQTAVSEDGGASWQRDGEPALRTYRVVSSLRGVGAKDDRLVSAPFVATAASTLTFAHGYVLGPQAGGVLEVSEDGGRTFATVPASDLSGHGYDQVSGGSPAFRGISPDPTTLLEPRTRVSLARYAGREVVVGWRLRSSGPGAPGSWALQWAHLAAVADRGCLDGTAPELACTTTVARSMSGGVPSGWAVDTPVSADGTHAWRASGSGPLLSGVATDASGTGAKDDRLVSPVFRATTTSAVTFSHRYVLEQGRDGGVLETTVDGGRTWQAVPPTAMTVGPYNGTLADGRPAWTGTHVPADGRLQWHGSGQVHVELHGFAGRDVAVRWRLLQDGPRTGSLPGHQWFLLLVELVGVVTDGSCPPAERTQPLPCDSLRPPAAVGRRGVTDDGRTVALDVLVALDVAEGPDVALLMRDDPAAGQARWQALTAEAHRLLAPMAEAYAPLGVSVQLDFELLAPLGPDGRPRVRPKVSHVPIVDGATGRSEPYEAELFRLAREQYGDRPPRTHDVVYVATDSGLEGGLASCVGGIASAEHAFALGNLDRAGRNGATIAAHEVGHLLGAQHHLANCAESAPTWSPNGPGTSIAVCTLMAPDGGLAQLVFSTANGSVVRGYATTFADRPT